MKKIFALIISAFFVTGCTLFEPSTLIIKNNSAFTICVNLESGINNKLKLDKKDGGFVLVIPGDTKIQIVIDEIGFSRYYAVNLAYNEKKEFIFNLE